jgi:hypothetical protein
MTATTQPVLFDIDSMCNISIIAILISFLSILMHFGYVFATELVTGKMVSLRSQRRWTVFVLPL